MKDRHMQSRALPAIGGVDRIAGLHAAFDCLQIVARGRLVQADIAAKLTLRGWDLRKTDGRKCEYRKEGRENSHA